MSSASSPRATQEVGHNRSRHVNVRFNNPYAYGSYFDIYNDTGDSENEDYRLSWRESLDLYAWSDLSFDEEDSDSSSSDDESGFTRVGIIGYGGYSDAAREGYFAGY